MLLTVLPEPRRGADADADGAAAARAHGAADGKGVDRCRLGRRQGHVMAGRR